MIVVALLTVKDFEALTQFENAVAPLLLSVGGHILHAIEVKRNEDGSGEEVHVLYFPSSRSLAEYKRLTSQSAYAQLRYSAITNIELKIESTIKHYASSVFESIVESSMEQMYRYKKLVKDAASKVDSFYEDKKSKDDDKQ
jgi:uncharacterized protein (DUF1330 family)